MKSKNIFFVSMLMLLPSVSMAQDNIQKAFDALRASKDIKELNARHSLDKNPDTGMMEGMEDTFDFMVRNSKARHLVENAIEAFQQDEPQAYTVSSGSHGGSNNYTSLAVGNSNSGGVAIGMMEDSQWIFACFLDPSDTLRQHRYAYALEWVDDGDNIRGRIVKTYATTQKFRQANKQLRTITVNGQKITLSGSGSSWSGSSTDDITSEAWLTKFTMYKNLFLNDSNGYGSKSYASRIYRLCKDTKSLDEVEKDMIVEEIEKLRKKTNDEFIQRLFDISIERLKK